MHIGPHRSVLPRLLGSDSPHSASFARDGTLIEAGHVYVALQMFEPTRMADPNGIVRNGVGRDAAEVAFCTQFGRMDYDKP